MFTHHRISVARAQQCFSDNESILLKGEYDDFNRHLHTE